MKTLKIIIFLAVTLCASVAVYGQGGLQNVLEDVENNNLTLRAARYDADARSEEARMGNAPDDLSVSYGHLWGNTSELGKTAELEVSQSFEFPTIYAQRSRRADKLSQMYSAEVAFVRQQILLEAKEIYVELCARHQMRELAEFRLTRASHMANLSAKRYDRGDATLVDKNRTEFERLMAGEVLMDIRSRILELENRLAVLNGGGKLAYTATDIPLEGIPTLESLIDEYEREDPTLAGLRLAEEGAKYDVKVSRSQAIPKFEVGYKHEYGPGERFNGVTAGLSIPIFSNRHNVKRAKAAQQAARYQSEAAEAQNGAILSELYQKAGLLRETLQSFSVLPDKESYGSTLSRLIEAGEINVVDYYSEMDAYYNAVESRLRVELEYALTAARLNMVYL